MDERRLYDLKWFDYRPLVPETATLAFTVWYVKRLGSYYDLLGESGTGFVQAHNSIFRDPIIKDPSREAGFRRGDGKDKRKLHPLKPTIWPLWSTMTALRQWADQRFLRYEDFWTWAMRAHREMGWGTKKRGDREYRFIPLSVFKSAKLLQRVRELAGEHERHFLTLSYLSFFKAKAFQGVPLQVDYMNHIAASLKIRYPTEWHRHLAVLEAEGRYVAPGS